MNKVHAFIITFLSIIALSSGCAAERAVENFCVRPGSDMGALDQCQKVEEFTEFTEEGEVTSFRIYSNGFTFTADVSSKKIDVLRFRQDPLPLDGVHIGDSYSDVLDNYPNLQLVFGFGEYPYVALAEQAAGLYIVFDADNLPEHWRGSVAPDVKDLQRLKVIAINLVAI